jgi:hypothetical protein
MKKLSVGLSVLVFCVSLMATTNVSAGLETNKVIKEEDPGIVCTVRDGETGNVIGRCYLCNCAKFAAAFFSQQ